MKYKRSMQKAPGSLHDFLRSAGVSTEGIPDFTDPNPEVYEIWYDKYTYFANPFKGRSKSIPLWQGYNNNYVDGTINDIYYIAKLGEYLRLFDTAAHINANEKLRRLQIFKDIVWSTIVSKLSWLDVVNYVAFPLTYLRHNDTEGFNMTTNAIETMGPAIWARANKLANSVPAVKTYVDSQATWNWLPLIGRDNISSESSMQEFIAGLMVDYLKSLAIKEAEATFRPGTIAFKALAVKAETEHGTMADPRCKDYPIITLIAVLVTLFKRLNPLNRQDLFEFEGVQSEDDEFEAYKELLDELTKNELCKQFPLYGYPSPSSALISISRIDDGAVDSAAIAKSSAEELLPTLIREVAAVDGELAELPITVFEKRFPTLNSLLPLDERRTFCTVYFWDDASDQCRNVNLMVCLNSDRKGIDMDIASKNGYMKFKFYPGSVFTDTKDITYCTSTSQRTNDEGIVILSPVPISRSFIVVSNYD